MEGEGVTLLLVNVDNWSFAVDVSQVETLRRKETMRPPHGGPPDLMGFAPLGECLLPILDLGIRLGVAGSRERRAGVLIIPPASVVPLAFRVDSVDGPVVLPWSALSPLPSLLQELQPRPVAWGMAWQGEDAVPLLDLKQIVPAEEVATLLDLAQEAVL